MTSLITSVDECMDEVTGDYEDMPNPVEEPHTEYDYIIEKSLLLLSKLTMISSIYESTIEHIYSLVISSFESVLGAISRGECEDDLMMGDYSVMVKMTAHMTFQEKNIDILVYLSRIVK